jgi:hypothetical protein
MRALAVCSLLLVLAAAPTGCEPPCPADVEVAEITSITAPGTVHAGMAFPVSVHVILGMHGCWVLDRVDLTPTTAGIEVKVWSRDDSNGNAVPCIVSETDLAFEAGPAEPGVFRIVSRQPNRSVLTRTVTVLP